MNYFGKITSFSDLKKEYRRLALLHHPDKGGDENAMKAINGEFERLYDIWKNVKSVGKTGYETEYEGATAKQYTDFVGREYRFTGSRYSHNLSMTDLSVIFRKFLKETYPTMKWSVRKDRYSSFSITLLEADFIPFVGENEKVASINHYHLENSDINDRAKDVFRNVIQFVMSYNYDDSDIMTDYFNTNFYVSFYIGGWGRDFKYVPVKLNGEKGITIQLGKTERTINAAMKGFEWVEIKGEQILCKKYPNGKITPLYYSGYGQARKRINTLAKAGIICEMSYHGMPSVKFVRYADGIEERMKEEREIAMAEYERKIGA